MPESTIEWIGVYALELLFVLLIVVLGLIILLWRLFERHYSKLWQWGKRLWGSFKSLSLVQKLAQRSPWLWSFLRQRLSPQGYLGIHLTLGLIIGFISFRLFAVIAEIVLESEAVAQFDQALVSALHHNAHPTAVTFFLIITDLAGRYATIGIGLIVGLILLLYRQRLLLISWVVTQLGGSLLNTGLKSIFQRARPEFENPFLVEANWSFPSGHAMGSLIIYGMLTYLLVILLNRYLEKVILVIAVALILLIGFSRMYLGVHYFSDILAGYVAGVGWLAITISGTEVARRRKRWQTAQEPEAEEFSERVTA
jgi:undecaprenyl-diphosphatase